MTQEQYTAFIMKRVDVHKDRPSRYETIGMTEADITEYVITHAAELVGPRILADYIMVRDLASKNGIDAATEAAKELMDFVHHTTFVCNPMYANYRFKCFFWNPEAMLGPNMYREETASQFINTDLRFNQFTINATLDIDVYDAYRETLSRFPEWVAIEKIMDPILTRVEEISGIRRGPIEHVPVTIDGLVDKLKELDKRYPDLHTYYPHDPTCKTLAAITEGDACELLISGGGCNWDNIYALRARGFDVYRGDSDSFGWLTGCIRSNDTGNILVYG